MVTEDVFADNSAEGLEAKLEEQPRAQLSSLPLPDPRRSAEQVTQGRGISQVTTSTNESTSSAPANADSFPCIDEFLA